MPHIYLFSFTSHFETETETLFFSLTQVFGNGKVDDMLEKDCAFFGLKSQIDFRNYVGV